MNKKGLGVFLIILGIFGGIYLYVLVGFFGSIGFGGGLIYAGYKLCTAKNFELVSEKIILNKSILYCKVFIFNLSLHRKTIKRE